MFRTKSTIHHYSFISMAMFNSYLSSMFVYQLSLAPLAPKFPASSSDPGPPGSTVGKRCANLEASQWQPSDWLRWPMWPNFTPKKKRVQTLFGWNNSFKKYVNLQTIPSFEKNKQIGFPATSMVSEVVSLLMSVHPILGWFQGQIYSQHPVINRVSTTCDWKYSQFYLADSAMW